MSWFRNYSFGNILEIARQRPDATRVAQRRDVHPLEEAQGLHALLQLEEPKYSIEQIAAKTGKSPSYVAQRLRLTELAPAVTEAFAKDEIGVDHALLLAKLQPQQQEEARKSFPCRAVRFRLLSGERSRRRL